MSKQVNRGDDLLNMLNKKSAEGATNTDVEPNQSEESAGNSKVGNQSSENLQATEGEQNSAENSKSASTKEEPSESNGAGDWTVDSALKEIKKLRDENKSQRLKYGDKLEEFRNENDSKLEDVKAKISEYAEYKKELEKLKTADEDKNRSLEEKLSHRESRIVQLETVLEVQKSDSDKSLEDFRLKLNQFEADKEASLESYRNRLTEEIGKVPEKFKDLASLLVKGAGDPRDALVALNEAKLSGMFEEKKIIVNHSVPGANDGARASTEQLEAVKKEQRSKMNSKDKIKTALSEITKGTANSAFKTR